MKCLCPSCPQPAVRDGDGRCKSHNLEKKRRRFKERYAKNHRRYHLQSAYGMLEEEYAALLLAQEGKCAICGAISISERVRGKNGMNSFVIDHDHVTGTVRGLLCNICNISLGGMLNDADLLRKALAYLDSNIAVEVLAKHRASAKDRAEALLQVLMEKA
jgi:Recombination endonuclease VII